MRRAAMLATCLVFLFAACNFYLDDDDRDRKNRPGQGEPDASCGNNHGDADAGPAPDGGVWLDGGYYSDAGTYWPDASPDW